MAPAVKYLGNIAIGAETPAYQSEVRRYLDLIATTASGRTLFMHINRRPKAMTIVPFKPTAERPVNAEAKPLSPADAIPEGFEIGRPPDRPDLPETIIGTGLGSAVVVEYHPANIRQLNQNMGGIAPGAGPGEVLLHEMLHGYRQMRGQMLHGETTGPDPTGEFYAVLAANVYRSERGFTQLRASWSSRLAAMKPGLADSENYYEEFKAAIDRWFAEDRSYCLDIAKVAARYNPFQAAAISLGLMKAPTTPMRLR